MRRGRFVTLSVPTLLSTLLFSVAFATAAPKRSSMRVSSAHAPTLSERNVEIERLCRHREALEYSIGEADRRARTLTKNPKLLAHRLGRLYKLSRGGLLRSWWRKDNGSFFVASSISRLVRRELESLTDHVADLEEDRNQRHRLRNHWLSLGDRLAELANQPDATSASNGGSEEARRMLEAATTPLGKKAKWSFATAKLEPGKATISRRGQTVLLDASEEIRAALGGKVSFIGALLGLRNVVIIEHPGGWHSVYGFLRATSLTVGQVVGRGATIGFAATDPLRKRFALYFELRKGTAVIDARPLLRGRRRVY